MERPNPALQSTDNGAAPRPTGDVMTPANSGQQNDTTQQDAAGKPGSQSGSQGTPTPANPMMTPQPMQPEDNNGMAEDDMALLDTLIPRVAEATCAALTQCCTSVDIEQFFQPLSQNGHLEDLKSTFSSSNALRCCNLPTSLNRRIHRRTLWPLGLAIKAGLVN